MLRLQWAGRIKRGLQGEKLSVVPIPALQGKKGKNCHFGGVETKQGRVLRSKGKSTHFVDSTVL
jgi:hypothetical protein